MIQESGLKDTAARFGDYWSMHGNIPQGGHGVTILVHRDIQYQTLEIKLPDDGQIEAIGVKIKLGTRIIHIYNIYAISRYVTPDNSWNLLWNQLQHPYIICGDFNAHHKNWGEPRDDARGRQVNDKVEDNNLVLLNDGKHTRIGGPGQRNTTIDLAFATPTIALACTCETMEDPHGSDHRPILLDIQSPTEGKIPYVQYHTTRKWHVNQMDKKKFQTYLDEKGKDLWNTLPSTRKYMEFVDLVTRAMDESTPKRKPRSPGLKHSPKPWWTPDCTKEKEKRNDLFKRFQQHKTPENFEAYQRQNNIAKDTFAQAKRDSWRTFVGSIQPRSPMEPIWRMAKSYAGRHTPPKHTDGEWLEDFLKMVALQPPGHDFNNQINMPIEETATEEDTEFFYKTFKPEDITSALSRSKDSAPGMDGITYSIIKQLPEEALKYLAKLYNHFWQTTTCPAEWKRSIVLPFIKHGKDPTEAESYRPIALTTCLLKTYQKMTLRRLMWWAETKHKLAPSQNGFRPGRSTMDSLSNLTTKIYEAFTEGKVMAVLFADVKGAYPNVQPKLLQKKLLKMGLPHFVTLNINNILMHRQLTTVYNGKVLGPRETSIGLNQGDIWSALLYILYTAELKKELPATSEIEMDEYADDFYIAVKHESPREAIYQLQDAAQLVENKLERNGAQLAPSKSQLVIFTRKKKMPQQLPTIQLNSGPAKRTTEAKFLGLIMDEKMTWTPHMNYLTKRCKERIPFLRSMSGHWWGSHPMTLYRTYQALIRSITDYGAGIYDPKSKKNWNKLMQIQSEALRICLGAMRSTPTTALRVEAMDWPMQTRHDMLLDRLILRWHSRVGHPTIQTLNTWSRKNNARKGYRPPLLRRFEELPISPIEIARSTLPPCYLQSYEANNCQHQIATQFPPNNITNLTGMTEKQQYERLRESTWKDYYLIATDGSKVENSPVGAAMIDMEKQPPYVVMNQLPSSTSIYEAEAQALLQAARYTRDKIQATKTIIISDSQSILRALSTTKISVDESPTIANIRQTLYDIRESGRETWLAWVPAHKGITPNEMADQAAALARRLGTPLIEPLHHREFHERITADHLEKWQATWDNPTKQPPTGRWTHRLHPKITTKAWYTKEPNTPRRVLTTIARIRLGHTHAPAHLHRIGAINNPLCICGEEGSLTHIINNCTFTDRIGYTTILQEDKFPEPYNIPEVFTAIHQPSNTLIAAFTALFAANPHHKL